MNEKQSRSVRGDSDSAGTRTTERKLMAAVLIVDDSSADRALLRTILGREGYTVYEVAKGRDALKKAREVRPHIVILDVNLPDISGLDVCRAIRADNEIAGLPVLDAHRPARRFRCARWPGSWGRRLRRQGLRERNRAWSRAPPDSISPDVQPWPCSISSSCKSGVFSPGSCTRFAGRSR